MFIVYEFMCFVLSVSEYIPGGELLALLDRYGKLPLDLVKIFVAEIAIAIGENHAYFDISYLEKKTCKVIPKTTYSFFL